jgi:hypothetical protein
MKHIKKIIVILVLSILLVSTYTPAASADLIRPGMNGTHRPHHRPTPKPSFFEYCFEIININDYPDYWLVEINRWGNQSDSLDNRIIKQDECVAPIKRGNQASIYAVRKSEVESNDIVTSDRGTKLKDFNLHKFKLIPATNTINPPHEEYGIEKVVDVLKIISIQTKSLDLNFQKVIYTFEHRQPPVIQLYQKQDERPSPLSFNNEPRNFLNLLIPGFSIIGMMLVYRKSKHFRKDYFS